MLIHNQYRISKLVYGGDIDVEWMRNNEIIHIGCEKSTPPAFGGKWLATYSDSHTESAECDSTSAITGSPSSSSEIPRTNLVSVEIGDCVRTILNYVFYRCYSLTSVGPVGSGASVEIPNSVRLIGHYAFYECTSLTSIIIPDSVETIGENAFNDCYRLTSITVEAVEPPTMGYGAFDRTNNCPIYVPAASVDAYKLIWNRYANRIQAIGG